MLSNKIKGCLYGYAIGDALGLGTEFMTRREVSARYPDGLTTYSQIIRDGHRSQWAHGQVSHDTNIVLLMVDSIIACRRNDHLYFARRFKDWFTAIHPIDIPYTIRQAVSSPEFAEFPHRISRKIYESTADHEPRNEALGRAMIVGMWPKFSEADITDNTRLTHWDPYCIASGAAIGRIAHDLLWNNRVTEFDTIYGITHRLDKRMDPYIDLAYNGNLEDLELDDEDTCWAAPKSAAATIWALTHHSEPGEALYEIISHGGDADTTGALVMGLMGLQHGFDAIPAHLVEGLLDRERLEQSTTGLTDVILEASK